MCLPARAALDAAITPHSGKGSGELGLNSRLEHFFQAGDVLVTDALYRNHFLTARLQRLNPPGA